MGWPIFNPGKKIEFGPGKMDGFGLGQKVFIFYKLKNI